MYRTRVTKGESKRAGKKGFHGPFDTNGTDCCDLYFFTQKEQAPSTVAWS